MTGEPGPVIDRALPAGRFLARVVSTAAADGDFRPDAAGVGSRQRALVDAPWTWLHQEHGAGVVVVDSAGDHAGEAGDAAVTTATGAPLSVRTADCVPVVLVGDGGLGVVHAGWRGVVAGVIAAAVDSLGNLGVEVHSAVVGPCICGSCYEFGSADLARVIEVTDASVVTTTRDGSPALDMRVAVAAVLSGAGVAPVEIDPNCTACGPGLWSHRARGDVERHVTVAWLESR